MDISKDIHDRWTKRFDNERHFICSESRLLWCALRIVNVKHFSNNWVQVAEARFFYSKS
jgi:hypothetical protein